MYKGRYVRAARAMAGWTLEEMSEKAGLGIVTLRDIENEKVSPRERTLSRINMALAKAGIEVTADGVREKREKAIVLDSENWFLDALDAIMLEASNNVPRHKRELLVWYSDDRLSPPEVIDRYRAMRAAGITMRQIVEQGNTYLMGDVAEYRWVPKEDFENNVTLIFGGLVILDAKSEPASGVLINDMAAADQQRRIFNLLWKVLPKPEESLADVRF